ncbi:Fe-S cluster assembly protein SufD [Pseudomaricurvus sp.]|uniref:Fe-S cluster assembly protein SufD n=1 Tax=Pseudomaricurvus sp. TaxID=2004510 RepID=UPI003F6BB473
MSNWLEGAVTRAELVSDWLAPQRQTSLALLREAQWPTRKTEAWKYLPINVWDRTELLAEADAASDAAVETIEGLNSLDLVFVNGKLESSLSGDLPAGLTVVSLADASADAQAWARETFTAVKPERHLFGLVNDVLATQGVLIDVADDAVIEQPVRIVNVLTQGHESHTRVLVRLGKNAKASVVEQFVGNQRSKNTGFAEYKIGESAYLEHYRFALQTGESLSIGGSHFELATRAELNSSLVGFGSTLQRIDVDVTHAGEHAFAKLNAIYLLDGKELFDLHSTIEHAVPNGTTEENVRGIVADNSRAVFNGRIHIHRDAQKTLAELNNRNLLMSDRAEIDTKPELEIYADDVRCAHGATVAQIDKKALYYMQTRGVSRSQAQIMLNFGFINELVDQMPNEALAEWLRPQLRDRFANMEVK